MLLGIDPLLTGELLELLDRMGHSDVIVIADAHFPASRLCRAVVDLPGVGAPRVLAAVLSVLPADADSAVRLMDDGTGDVHLPVQTELSAVVAGRADVLVTPRFDFYDAARAAQVVIRTGEMRPFGNAIVAKGVVPPWEPDRVPAGGTAARR